MLEATSWGASGEHVVEGTLISGDDSGSFHSSHFHAAYNPLAWGIHSAN